MSNSTSRNGGATLFFTTFTRVRFPITVSPSLMVPARRMSGRCEAEDLSAFAQVVADPRRRGAGGGLRDQAILGADAELARVADVERVLGVDERGDAARLLRLGDHVQGQRSLAARRRSVDLDDAAAWNAADAEREVQRDAPGRDRRDVLHQRLVVAETHDGAFAELLLDGRNGKLDRLLFFRARHSFPPLGSTVRLYRSVSLGARCHPGLTRPRSRQETLLKPRIT